jgi:hypothetical protein
LTEKIETSTKVLKEILTLPQQPVYLAIQAAPPLAALAPPLVIETAPDQQAATSSQLTTELGEMATAYFKRFASKTKDADTT